MSEEERRKKREYFRKRHESHPEIYEKDKNRYRIYMMQRRQDPEFRRMENDKRRERRQKKRESSAGANTSSRRRITTTSNRSARKPKSPVKKSTRQATVSSTEAEHEENEMEDEMISTGELDHGLRLKDDPDSSPKQVDTNYDDDDQDISYNTDSEIAPEESSATEPQEEMEQEHVLNVSIVQANERPQPATLASEEPPCSCSHSPALANLAALSRDLSTFERRKLESGLIRFTEDFINSPPDDTFTLLICDKLKRVSEDLRPDLEVTILKTINDTLKGIKSSK